jgi:TonB-dependent starch-binding outer membrane protein SusC
MKYTYLILLVLLAFLPATYAVGNGNTGQMSIAQQGNITVKGKVVDEKGEPLPGASVIQRGTNNGAITDIDGNFSISVPSDATLIISFIGYLNEEIVIAGKSELGSIKLIADVKTLDQVVVIGYGTQRKVNLTSSVSIVNTEEMKKVSNSNISTILEGKVAGVQITTDGQPGADPSVRIRGLATFGTQAPLYVIDGIPMGYTIRDFSPNDIESLQVLKDASAGAIYGSRAANGVIIITTKQGKKNQPMRIDYSGYYGFDKIPSGEYDVMDAVQYKDYITMAYNNSTMDVPSGYDSNSANYLYNADGSAKVNTDWVKEVFKTGVRQNHNLNFSGGGEHNTYNLALDYYSQKGTIEGAGPNLDRYTARINNTMEVKFIKFKTNIAYTHSSQDNMALSNASEYVEGLYGTEFPVMASALILPPTIKAYDPSTWCLDDKISAASNYSYDSYGYGTYYDDIHGDLRVTNVLLLNNLLTRNTKVDRIVSSGSADVDLIGMVGLKSSNHRLNYNLNLSYSKTIAKDLTFIPSFIQSTTNYLAKSEERLIEGYRNYSTALIENTLTYDGKIGLNHINVVAGQTFERELTHNLTGTGTSLSEPYFLELNNASETAATTSDYEHVLTSYIGRVNYDFDEKYLLSVSARRDGSSRFESGRQFGVFPSVSAGWRVEREPFFTVSKSVINLFKLRGSYGALGNENIGDYLFSSTMTRNNYTYSLDNTKVTGSAISNYVNTKITWEKKKTLDFGIDLSMFSSKLEFNIDWYKAVSEDLLYDIPVPAQAGVTNTTVTSNASTMENSGFEFLVSYHGKISNIKYDITANASTLKNKVTKLGPLNTPYSTDFTKTEVGSEVGSFYGYVSEGLFRSQDEVDTRVNANGNYITQKGAKEGDIKYADLNNDGSITSDDRQYLGSGIPKFNYGLNFHVEWKGIDLSVATFGAGGFKALDFVDLTLHNTLGPLNKSVDMLNAYNAESDAAVNGLPVNTNTDVPRISYKTSSSYPSNMFSNRFLQNAAYLKISNIELGYNVPDKWFSGYVKGMRVYASAQNLYTFTKYKGYNVDFAGGIYTPGYNYCSYPTPRTIMFGAHFSF